jgi:hypothetical protein
MFEVSAQWMKACGRGSEPKVFTIIDREFNMVGRKGMDCLLTLRDDDGSDWKVFVGRGKIVA